MSHIHSVDFDLCVVHFLPIAKYPPLHYLIHFLGQQAGIQCTIVCSGKKEDFQFAYANVSVHFVDGQPTSSVNKKIRFWSTVKKKLRGRSFDACLGYGDEFSGLIATTMSCKWRGLHLHELPPSLHLGNKFLSRSQRLEIFALRQRLKRFHWISQVTPERASLFAERFGASSDNLFNFPPKSFAMDREPLKPKDGTLRVLYVGSCNAHSIHVEALHDLSDLPGISVSVLPTNRIGLDEVKANKKIQILHPCPYHELPEILAGYDVGMVLYKGASDNMRLGVPNKVVEYVSCGLFALYVSSIEGIRSFVAHRGLENIIIPFDPNEVSSLENAVDRCRSYGAPRFRKHGKSMDFESEYDRLLKEIKSHLNSPEQ